MKNDEFVRIDTRLLFFERNRGLVVLFTRASSLFHSASLLFNGMRPLFRAAQRVYSCSPYPSAAAADNDDKDLITTSDSLTHNIQIKSIRLGTATPTRTLLSPHQTEDVTILRAGLDN
jgi:hypothetical protein